MPEREFFVYKHTNLENGKVYIGITCNLAERWRGNGCAYKQNRHFMQAIKKYGWIDGFSHEIVASGLSKDDACAMEIELIAKYQSCDRKYGYNNSPGGENPLVVKSGEEHPFYGKHHSEEARRKMSEAKSGENHPCYGKHLSETTRRKIGDANRWHITSDEQKELLRNANLGKRHTEETRRKMSDSRTGHAVSEETREKIRATKKNSVPVVQKTLDGIVLKVWPSMNMAAHELGLVQTNISRCCKGIFRQIGGFRWEFAE